MPLIEREGDEVVSMPIRRVGWIGCRCRGRVEHVCGFKVVVVSEGGIVTNDNDGIVVDIGENCCTPKGFLTQ